MPELAEAHPLARSVRVDPLMRNGFRIGRLFGIELRADTSWLLILVLVVWSLSSLFASWHPDWSPLTTFAVAVAAALAFFGSVVFHEMAHSLVATFYGIPVRDITLHMFGGVSNIEREPPTPGSEFFMAVVGPLASIGLGIAMTVAGALIGGVFGPDVGSAEEVLARLGPVTTAIMWLGPINVMVGVFNLVPGFPLDGGRILRSILWKITGSLSTATMWAARAGQLVGWAFIAIGVFMALGYRVPFLGSGFTGGLWIALIGLFLRNAAVQYHRGAEIQDALAGVRAADLMRQVPPTWAVNYATATHAHPDEPVAEVLRRMGNAGVTEIPVVANDTMLGVIFESDVARWLELRRPTHRTIRTRPA
jgi:Zn-dependent protease